jgi:hypothetical protein
MSTRCCTRQEISVAVHFQKVSFTTEPFNLTKVNCSVLYRKNGSVLNRFLRFPCNNRNCINYAITVSVYGLDMCSIPGRGKLFSSYLPCPYWLSAVSTGDTFPGEKQPVHKIYHSLLSSAEIRKEWSYTSTTPRVFMASCLTQATEKAHPTVITGTEMR